MIGGIFILKNRICAGARGGENLKVIVQHNFRDKENDLVLRTVGEELEVSKKRAKYLSDRQLVQVMEDQKGGDPESPKEAEG